MKQNKDIKTFNDKGEYHGYQEWYDNNKPFLRCMAKNSKVVGYSEWYESKQTMFIIR